MDKEEGLKKTMGSHGEDLKKAEILIEHDREMQEFRRKMIFPTFKDKVGRDMTEGEYLRFDIWYKEKAQDGQGIFDWIKLMGLSHE